CLAALHAAGMGMPGSLPELLEATRAGTPEEAELSPWFDPESRVSEWPWVVSREVVEGIVSRAPLEPAGGGWRLAAIESVVVGPARFNTGLRASGSKAEVHFAAFAGLLRRAWERAGDGASTFVTGDKHGGRHYYLAPLSRAFPDA